MSVRIKGQKIDVTFDKVQYLGKRSTFHIGMNRKNIVVRKKKRNIPNTI